MVKNKFFSKYFSISCGASTTGGQVFPMKEKINCNLRYLHTEFLFSLLQVHDRLLHRKNRAHVSGINFLLENNRISEYEEL
jgi:hypothetical protein